MTTKLRLGPIPEQSYVRITISISTKFKTTLDRYAEAHAQATGHKHDVARLIPYMLESFVASYHAFKRSAAAAPSSKAIPRS